MYLLESNNSSENVERRKVDIGDFDAQSSTRILKGFEFIEECEECLPEMTSGAIFGSTAKDKASIGSDIDITLVIEGDSDYRDVMNKVHSLVEDEELYEMSPHFVNERDLKDRKLLNDPPYLTSSEYVEEFEDYVELGR